MSGKGLLAAALLGALLSAPSFSAAAAPPAGKGALAPGPGDKCPVCGMFVAKFPDFAASLRLPGAVPYYFDGVKDLLEFRFAPARYGRDPKGIEGASVLVTDYYTLEAVDGREAWYVLGSDVYGPMGKELVPFAREKDARTFLRDHKGKALLRYRDLVPSVLKELR